MAKEVLDFFNQNFKDDLALELWDSRTYESKPYTCWWVSFRDANTYKTNEDQNRKLCMLIAINLWNNSKREDADICLKFMSLLNKEALRLVGWKSDNRGYYIVPF